MLQYMFIVKETERPRQPEQIGEKNKASSTLETLGEFICEMAKEDLDPQTRLLFEEQNLQPPEKRFRTKVKEKSLSVGQKMLKPFFVGGAFLYASRVESNIVKPIRPEYPEGFKEKFTELMKDPSVLPVLISNHTGHADAITMAVVTRDLTRLANKVRPFEEWLLTMAASLESAYQNVFMQQMTKQGINRFSKYKLTLQPYVRDKDREKYGMKDREINREYAARMGEILRNDDNRTADGLAFFIEGTVEGGRRIKDGEHKGERNGLQKIDFNQYEPTINKAQNRHKRKVTFIFLSSRNAFEVLDPETEKLKPTEKAIRETLKPFRPKQSLMGVKVSMPIFYNDILKEIELKKGRCATANDVGEEIGIKLAENLPPQLQGYYRDLVAAK